MKINVTLMLVFLTCTAARADEWTTSDGKTFHSVKVLSHDDGYVMIMDSDGGGRVPLRTLTPELQKQFGYDVVKAAACEAATVVQDKHDNQAVTQAERTAQVEALPSTAAALRPQVASTPANAQAPSTPPVPNANVAANEGTIRDDQEKLARLETDLQEANKMVFGDRQAERVTYIVTQQKELHAEIDRLQKEDSPVTQQGATAAAPPQAPFDTTGNNAQIEADQLELDKVNAELRDFEKDRQSASMDLSHRGTRDHVDALYKRSNELRKEIAALKLQSTSAGQATNR